MRILHLSKFYPPSRGGLEDIVAKLSAGAAARGHQVHVVCGVGPDEPAEAAGVSEADGVVVHRFSTIATVWSQPIVPGYISAAARETDIAHIHHPHPLADIAVLKSVRAPFVITHHSDVRRQSVARPVVNLFAGPVRDRAARICVPTNSHITVSEEIGKYQDKCSIVPFGVDDETFRPDRTTIPTVFAAHQPVGLFVGRLVGYKGLPVLLDAVEGTSLKVVIAGTGPLQSWLEGEVSNRDLGRNVVLAGQVSESDLPDYYAAASYFVLPSISEAEMFGVTLIEAMASGTPIITTELPTGVSEVNSPGEVGLSVPVKDSIALRAAMQRLSDDAGLRELMGRNARARVLERFSLEKMVSAQLEVYSEVLAR